MAQMVSDEALVTFDRSSVRIERACSRFCRTLTEEMIGNLRAATGQEPDSEGIEKRVRESVDSFMSDMMGLGSNRNEIYTGLRNITVSMYRCSTENTGDGDRS